MFRTSANKRKKCTLISFIFRPCFFARPRIPPPPPPPSDLKDLTWARWRVNQPSWCTHRGFGRLGFHPPPSRSLKNSSRQRRDLGLWAPPRWSVSQTTYMPGGRIYERSHIGPRKQQGPAVGLVVFCTDLIFEWHSRVVCSRSTFLSDLYMDHLPVWLTGWRFWVRRGQKPNSGILGADTEREERVVQMRCELNCGTAPSRLPQFC